VAATPEFVIVSDREVMDTLDSFKCLRAADGKEIWSHQYLAAGALDYGNSPRATPLIYADFVYLFGAFGHLTCAELATGKVVWEIDTRDKFGADDERKWGTCSSPLIAENKLIINPGAEDASVVALDPKTGDTVWKTPGGPASYGSFLAGTFGGVSQIVGFDLTAMCGWDAATGKRLWRRVPDAHSQFNVATPVQVGDRRSWSPAGRSASGIGCSAWTWTRA
jgi:outer membrane protein assembly factor BamB